MKYFWQQLLAFLSVILLASLMSGFWVADSMQEELYAAKEEQLMGYGHNIIANSFSRNDIVTASQLLASEDIFIQVFLEDGRIIYPTYDTNYNAHLTQEELDQIGRGEELGLRTTVRYQEDSETFQQLTVYLPITYEIGPFPKGFISLSAPLAEVSTQIASVQKKIFTSFVVATIAAFVMSVIYSAYQTRKIKDLQVAAREIAQGHYELKLAVKGEDEFADLAMDFQKMADSLVASNEEISRQETLRRQFMMDAMHEMRTPLTTMAGLLEGLEYGMIPENQRQRSLELISKETKRLTRLVNENLDYEKIQMQQFSLNKKTIQLHQLFEDLQTQIQVTAQEKGNQVEASVARDLTVYADYDRLSQIIINLLANANQFSDHSTIELKAYPQGDWRVIVVKDSGIGIEAKDLDSIWERFYKADPSRKSLRFGESGIGLSVVSSLVKAHQGKIEVESQLGQGSTFKVYLPTEEALARMQAQNQRD